MSQHRGRLVLRADASHDTGTGHLMRLLALAQAWRDRGGTVDLHTVGAPPNLLRRFEAEAVRIHSIDALRPPGSVDDGRRLAAVLRDHRSAVCAIDGLQFGASFLRGLGQASDRVLLVDDAAALDDYPVGLVLNQNAHADRAAYPANAKCRFLLGTTYVMLRREFVHDLPPPDPPLLATHLLVTFGGADPGRITGRVIQALASLAAPVRELLEVRVVVGAANADAANLELAARALDGTLRVRLERDVTDMPGLIRWAHLAITSGGSTVWELARMGCPALVVETVPVESLLAGGLAATGLGHRLGSAEHLDDATITMAVASRIEDVAWRREMAAMGRRLVDGNGAGRVVDALAMEARNWR